MTTKDKLINCIIQNPGIVINPNEICLFQARGQLVKSINTTTTVTKKPGLGLGITIPITKHFGIGLSKHRVKTETRTTRTLDKIPCEFYMLGTRFLIKDNTGVSQIDNDDIRSLEIHSDAIEFKMTNGTIAVTMDKTTIKNLKKVWGIIGQARKEGIQFEDIVAASAPRRISTPNYNGNIRSEQGDYAKTIFLSRICKNAAPIKKRAEYPQYVFYELGIQNGTTYHKQLVADGYLNSPSIEERLKVLKTDELKFILEKAGQKKTGKKADLIQRIAENVSEIDLDKSLPNNLYVLSDKGKQFITDHNDYLLIYKHPNWQLDWKNYDLVKSQNPSLRFYDYCWGVFNKRILDNRGNLQLDRNEYFNMFSLLKEEKKDYQALEMLLKVFYIDVNISKMIAPGIVKEIGNLESVYDSNMIDQLYTRFKIPRGGCKKTVFKEMVEEIVAGTYSDEKYMYRI